MRQEKSQIKAVERTADVKIPVFGVHRIIPSLVTLMALGSGLLSILLVIKPENINSAMIWEKAVILILVAAVLDMLDGAVARLLKATSEIGAQLDSFSDFLAFGVAPSVVLYMWALNEAGKFGLMAVMVYVMATALRLARFNVTTSHADSKPEWARKYFEGVPSPIGAFLSLLPMAIWFQSPDTFSDLSFAVPLVALWIIGVAALMVSRLPTFSSKQMRFHSKMAFPILAVSGFLIAALLSAPWITFTALSFLYLVSIPVSFMRFKKLRDLHASGEDMTDLALGAIDLGVRSDNDSEEF